METVEREIILIVYAQDDINEIEKVIIYKDRETALDALFGEHSGHSILMTAEVNRVVTPVVTPVATPVTMPLPGLEA